MSDPITFNHDIDPEVFYGPRIHNLVRRIVLDTAEWALHYYGWIFRVTSLIRTPEEDRAVGGSGIHCTGRAVDIGAKGVPEDIVDLVAKWVNEQWQYDPARPDMVVCYAKPHGTGPHLHFQVHAKTGVRGEL